MYKDTHQRKHIIDRHILNHPAIHAVIPMIVQLIEREGHCIQRARIERIYGKETVEVMLYQKNVRALTVIVKDKKNMQPDQKIPCLVTNFWDESKPLWVG